MIITKTKLDSFFPSGQFSIDGFAKPFFRDRNQNRVKLMVNIKKAKCLVAGCNHRASQIDNYYFCNLSRELDSLSSNYEKFLLIGNFNLEDHETEISRFLKNHEAKS